MDKPGETDHNGSSRSVQKDGVYRAIIDPTIQSAFLDRRKTRVKSDVLSKTTNTTFQMRSVTEPAEAARCQHWNSGLHGTVSDIEISD